MFDLAPIEFNLSLVKQYLRIEHDLDDVEINLYINAAISYVKNYTQATDEIIFQNTELLLPMLNLVAYFYENKTTLVSANNKISEIFSSILNMHRENIL
ncbi:head-tail connector protein [Clostridium sp.]|uniref:head-tail connector protein n=1 Tax=Clostridium sp. TaxID=1506 RepID=UPI002FC9F130